jgi:hypothetical protein
MLVEHLLGGDVLETADVAGVPAVPLVLELAAGEVDLRRVQHDHVVTHVEVRSEGRLVLASEDRRHLGSQASQHQSLGVDDVPLALDLAHRGPFD